MNTIQSTDLTVPTVVATTVQPPVISQSEIQPENDSSVSPFPEDNLLQSNILVVDDDLATTRMINSSLCKAGFTCVKALNHAREAVEFLKQNSPDVILLDLRMPEIDGIAILKSIRSQRRTQFVPVIVLTSDRDDDTRLKALNAGANDFVNKPMNQDELVARVKNALSFRLHADKIEKQVESVTQELEIDALTGLHNRRAFDTQYGQMFSAATSGYFSLILVDIDNFKQANDSCGHLAGDEVLKQIASIMLECCDQHEVATRIGGDEFAILCRHSDKVRPVQVAERIRNKISRSPTRFDGEVINTTISVGVATTSEEIDEKGKLFKAADAALYQSKHQGRNTLNVFSEAVSLSDVADLKKHAPALSELANSIRDPKLAEILIVDDEVTVTQMVKLQLKKAGYENVHVLNDATQAITSIETIRPDIVILDVRMPGINGLEILRLLRDSEQFSTLPVLVMTATDDEQIRMAALKLRANDFVTKPAKPAELDTRVNNSLLAKFQHDRLNQYADRLKHEVEVRTEELFATRRETILCMARAGESRDTETGNHVIRVGYYAAVIARKLGLEEDQVGWIELAAQLHDVGKLSIPDAILQKPGPLTVEERRIIETHCDNADSIFFGKAAAPGQTVITSPLLKMAARIASSHHEHWDGNGYPRKLVGEEIPLEGRITSVADVFDALSSKRSYKQAFTVEKCIEIMMEGRGSQFDPQVFDAFIDALDEILTVRSHWQDANRAEG